MKLLIFSPFYPPHIGGVENYTQELSFHLANKGVEIIIFTPHIPNNSPEKESDHQGVTVIRFPAFEIISNYPIPKFWQVKFWRMFSGIFMNSFDVVLSQTRFFNTSLLALAYSKWKNIPWINIEHGSAFVKLSSKVTSWLAKLYDLTFGSLVLSSSTANVSISKAVSDFIRNFDKRESSVIYRGLDLNNIDMVPKDNVLQDKYKDKLIIVFSGRLYKWKGVENSVRAVKELPQEIKDKVIFLIIGDGEDFSAIKRITDKTVVMLGSLPREKVFSVLKIADIFIHSALPGGGLSTSLLEAMYCRCAIVATPNEGAREVIINKKNGLLISESNPGSIGKKIIELFKNPESREEYSSQARKTVKDLFDWNVNAEKYIEYFKEILKNYSSK